MQKSSTARKEVLNLAMAELTSSQMNLAVGGAADLNISISVQFVSSTGNSSGGYLGGTKLPGPPRGGNP